ncbi:MarR family transcriptional regulator [uncultured Tateyamaria sp.]|uniref:MarR family winged helix-turn-helix transcriptional regulator n=1 Tax=uncultured Tateyamaria sp. TaxID=455651 RepID=UPI00260AFA89|nr:MarR family transcriptional regulator [uncultured Tateyamaria sp.]
MTDTMGKAPPLLDQQLCFALYSTSRAITKVYADLLEKLGLTYPQYLAMLVLWEKDGLSVQEIADRLQLEGATTTPLIQRIERMGLVLKKRSTTDERRQDVFLTEKGRALGVHASSVPERLGCALNITDEKAYALLDEIKRLRAAIV